MIKRNFDPGFLVEHFLKDMGIALEEARRMSLALPGLALVHQLYVAVQAQGHGRGGTQSLVLALEHISNLPRPPVTSGNGGRRHPPGWNQKPYTDGRRFPPSGGRLPLNRYESK